MKKSYKTYLLLALVLGIWGFIGIKVLGAINPPTEKTSLNTTQQPFTPKSVQPRDTFAISANYRDPFLGTLPKSSRTKPKKAKSVAKPVPEMQIAYTGLIEEHSSNKKIFFLTVDGQQQMMSVKDTFKEVRLIYGDKSKVKVVYKGKTKTIDRSE